MKALAARIIIENVLPQFKHFKALAERLRYAVDHWMSSSEPSWLSLIRARSPDLRERTRPNPIGS